MCSGSARTASFHRARFFAYESALRAWADFRTRNLRPNQTGVRVFRFAIRHATTAVISVPLASVAATNVPAVVCGNKKTTMRDLPDYAHRQSLRYFVRHRSPFQTFKQGGDVAADGRAERVNDMTQSPNGDRSCCWPRLRRDPARRGSIALPTTPQPGRYGANDPSSKPPGTVLRRRWWRCRNQFHLPESSFLALPRHP